MTGATAGAPVAGQYGRVDIGDVKFAQWTTTKWTKRQAYAIKHALHTYGQLVPLVVRDLGPGHGWRYECIDGSHRLEALEAIGAVKVDILDVGQVDDAAARELHLVLNLGRGKPAATPLADALEHAVNAAPTDAGKAMKEVELAGVLPLNGGPVKAAARLRAKGQTPARSHNPSAPRGWVDFRFKVDPGAAKVCDDAITQVTSTTGCERHVAFERICADYLAGPSVGRQP
jgi:hypothetical protein